MKNLDALKQHGDIIWNIANLLRGPYLRVKLAGINTVELAITDAIEKLTEYRSALITAATTGKIDVRGWQAAKEAA